MKKRGSVRPIPLVARLGDHATLCVEQPDREVDSFQVEFQATEG